MGALTEAKRMINTADPYEAARQKEAAPSEIARQKERKRSGEYASLKALQEARRAKGLCPKCGKERDEGFILCNDCREKQRAWYKKRLTSIHAEGKCSRCGAPLDIPYKLLCKACRDKARLYYQKKKAGK